MCSASGSCTGDRQRPAAWALSYAQPSHWRLIGIAHSADLTRVDRGPRTTLFTTTADWSRIPNHGFWDAGWVLSRSGRLTLLAQAVVFGRMPDHGRRASRLGFAWHADAQLADGVDGPVSARAWMVTLPYWLLVLLGLPMPLLWRRVTRRRRDTAVS